MDVQFSQIAAIKLKHEFYSSGLAECFDLLPSPLSQQKLKIFDCRLKSGLGELDIYLRHGKSEQDLNDKLAELPEKFNLCFGLAYRSRENTSEFLSVTEIPLTHDKGITYRFNNLEEGRQLLSKESLVSAEDQVEFSGPLYQLRVPSGRPQFAAVYDASGKLRMSDRIGKDEIRFYTFDLGQEDWGHYTIGFSSTKPPVLMGDSSLNKSEKVTYFPDGIEERVFGFIQLHLQRTQLNPTQPYTLNFGARSSKWSYHLITKSDLDFKVINLKEGKRDLEIIDPEFTGLPDGNQAQKVIINAPIKFSQKQVEKITLELYDIPAGVKDEAMEESLATSSVKTPAMALLNSNHKKENLDLLYNIPLPKPQPKQMQVERMGDELNFVSQIFVYL